MNAPVTFTGTVKAWTTSRWTNADEVLRMVAEGNVDDAAGALAYVNHDMGDAADWVEVGVAQVTVTMHPRDVTLAKELDGLQAQLQAVRAENQRRENAILDRISKLQAIEHAGEQQ